MGGGLELCVFPEQSTLRSSSPVPPEVSPGGSGTVGGCPGCALHPACSHLPDSCPLSLPAPRRL